MKILFFLTILLCLTSCVDVQPPQRPVAYLFPTVRTMGSLSGVQPLSISRQDLDMALHAAGLANALKQSGMLEMDYDVILRGLSQRGFAELDARRAKTPFQWITFSALPNHQLEIIACFTRQPPQEFLSSPLEATTRCPLLLEKAELCQQSPWMIRWLFIRH